MCTRWGAPPVWYKKRVGVGAVEFAAVYPRLFHMAEVGAGPSLRSFGLQSAEILVERYGPPAGRTADELLAARRPEAVRLEHPGWDPVVLRDNKVLSDARLDRCLVGMSRPEYYRMLNSRVYLWPSRHRVDGLLRARPYRDRPHLVLELDTARLLARHAGRVRLSPINIGSTLFTPPPRGPATACPPADYPWADRLRARGRRDAVAEVSVDGELPDLAALVVTVAVVHPDGRRETGFGLGLFG